MADHANRGTMRALESWILQWKFVHPKAETAKKALYAKLLKQKPKEQLFTVVKEVGEDAFGEMKHTWTVAQRRLVVSAFINGFKYKQANHHLQQKILEGID